MLTGELDVRVGLPHVDAAYWAPLLDEAETVEPAHYAASNGWVVAALPGTRSAISRTTGLVPGLHAAGAGGGDTDTVAAIAGQLLGAAYGGSAVPATYRRRLHGWPGLRVRGLHRLAFLAVHRGQDGPGGWPSTESIASYRWAETTATRHPDDEAVLLGAVAAVYGAMVTGSSPRAALDRVLAVLPASSPRPSFVRVLEGLVIRP